MTNQVAAALAARARVQRLLAGDGQSRAAHGARARVFGLLAR